MLMLSSGSIWTPTRNVILSPSGLPGVDDVARPAARRKEQHVDTDILAVARVAVAHRFRRRCNPAQPESVDRGVEVLRRGPPLDLDEDHRPLPSRHEIYLASRRLDPARDHAPTVQTQPERAPTLAPATATLGDLALHPPRSSSARA